MALYLHWKQVIILFYICIAQHSGAVLWAGSYKALKQSSSGAWTFECTVSVFGSCCHVKHGRMLNSGYWTICIGKLMLNQPRKRSVGAFTCSPLSSPQPWAAQRGAAWLSTPAQAWRCVRKTSACPLPITCFSLEGNQSRKVARDSQGAMLSLLEDVFPPHSVARGELLLLVWLLCDPQFNHSCYSPVSQQKLFVQ